MDRATYRHTKKTKLNMSKNYAKTIKLRDLKEAFQRKFREREKKNKHEVQIT